VSAIKNLRTKLSYVKHSIKKRESCLGTILCYVELENPEKNRQQDSSFGSLAYEKTHTISVLKAPRVNVLYVLVRNTDTYQ